MNKTEFLKKLEQNVKQEHLDSAVKVLEYISSNEDIADFALRLLLAALDVNAQHVVRMAINEKAEFTNKPTALETVMTIKGLKTHAERYSTIEQQFNINQ